MELTTETTALETGGLPPLQGVTVLEFCEMFAGPFSTAILAELGARVIKVEPPHGDRMRMAADFPELGGVKANQGKESVALNLQSEEGRQIVYELVKRANIVIESYRGDVAKRLGIDASTLRAVNPRIVYLACSRLRRDKGHVRIALYMRQHWAPRSEWRFGTWATPFLRVRILRWPRSKIIR